MSAHRAKPPSTRARTRAALALAAALAVLVGAAVRSATMTPVATTDDVLAFLRSQRSACEVERDSAPAGSSARTRAVQCINDATRAINYLLAQTPSPTPSGTPTATPTVQPTVTASSSPTTTSPAPSPTVSPTASPSSTPTPPPSPSPTTPAGWPGPANTGVPVGVTLTPYTGPCTITVANTVIDAKMVSCDLSIATTGVHITRSWITGTVSASTSGSTQRLLIEDSLIDAGHRLATGLGDGWFTANRIEIIGGNRGAYCAYRCTIQDSWVHGTYVEADWHASAIRAEQYSTLIHNTISCSWYPPTAQDGGCSADLTGYPDFTSIHDWLIQGNLFVANPGASFCAYGGSSGGKPFSSDPMTAVNVQFIGNTGQRGTIAGDKGLFRCGFYGAVDSFNAAKAGAVWSGNVWDDGSAVTP